MRPDDGQSATTPADVGLVLEGTYPYVRGGVSSWVHELIGHMPELRFAVVHVGPEPGTYKRRHYVPPQNVVSFTDLYCRQAPVERGDRAALERAAQRERHRHTRSPAKSRMLRGIRRLHLDRAPDASLLEDLASGDLSVEAFLHGRQSFELTEELYEALAPGASFVAFHWHVRSMHLPLVRLLGMRPPPAGTYHSVCTGYAGLLAAAWSLRTGRPFILTEHGIYTRERRLELDRAAWLTGTQDRRRPGRRTIDEVSAAALRRVWLHFFHMLSRCAYRQATTIISLCEASRVRQVADGAPMERTRVVPNGIDLAVFDARCPRTSSQVEPAGRVRVGFVGRLVPIKDLVTFVRACFIARSHVELEARVIGPTSEDPRYVRRCWRLVRALGLEGVVHFEGQRSPEQIYSELDMVVLTSFSEGQPLVILEAGAAGVPVIASDVGACRELLEGRSEADRLLGRSGIVTRLAAPEETAAAIVRLAENPALRRSMGATGKQRVARFYRQRTTVTIYRSLYTGEPWPESAGVLNA